MSTETASNASAAHHAVEPTAAADSTKATPHAHFDASATSHEAKHHIHARAGDALLHRGEMDQPELEKAVDSKRATIEHMRGKVLAMMGEVMRIHETLQVEEHALGVLEGALNAKHGVWPAARKQPLREAAAAAVAKHRADGVQIARKAQRPDGMLIVIEANDDGEDGAKSTFSPPETQQRKETDETDDDQLEKIVTALLINGLQQNEKMQHEHGIKPPANGEAIIIPAFGAQVHVGRGAC